MARTDDVITDYLDQLRRVVPANPTLVRTMVAEAETHLHDATQRHIVNGMDPDAAVARAIEEFGPPDVVAQSFLGSRAELPRPGRMSRSAGRAGVAGLVALVVGLVLLNTPLAEVEHKPGPGDDIGWGISVGLTSAGVAMLLFAIVGMTVRLGRRLGRLGVIGNVVLLLALPLSLPFGYGGLYALAAFVALGFALLAVPAYRAGDLPRIAVGLVLAGPVIAVLIVALTELLDGDASEYLMLAVPPVIVGWVWMNVSLAREPHHRFGQSPLSMA